LVDVPTNIRHRPALLWRFSWFWHQIQSCRLTCLLNSVVHRNACAYEIVPISG